MKLFVEKTTPIVEALTLDSNVKEWYKKKYKTDDYGDHISDTLTFKELNDAIGNVADIYSVIFSDDKKGDSIVRERLFYQLASLLNVDYEEIYDRWIDTPDPEVDDMVDKIKQLRASRNESVNENMIAEPASEELLNALNAKLKEFEGRGYDEDDLKIYVDSEIPNKIWFTGELSYSTQSKLAEELDKVIQEFNEDAYFDAEDSGRWFAYLWKEGTVESKEPVQEELNFDREGECDWCGRSGKVAVTHYGTSHYNRLVCSDCAKELNVKESKKLNETGEWEDDAEGIAWKEALVRLVKSYTEGIKGFEFDESDVKGFDKYQGPYISTEMGTIWSDGERDDSFIVEYGNAYYRISSREDAEDLASGALRPLEEDYSARQSKFYPSLDNRRTDEVTPDNIKWLEANSPDIENARDLIAQAYDILKPMHYNSKVVYVLGEALGMIDMDLELIQPKEGETTECLNQPDPFANASESVNNDPEVTTIKESAMFGEESVEDKTDYAQLLEKYYGADAVKLAEENELTPKSVFFFMECHATLDPVVSLKEELMEGFNKEEFIKLYD